MSAAWVPAGSRDLGTPTSPGCDVDRQIHTGIPGLLSCILLPRAAVDLSKLGRSEVQSRELHHSIQVWVLGLERPLMGDIMHVCRLL